ncbi:hypothetical protein [Mycobacterium sp. URHB0044]|uniref:hypothetical protein n=1 Tax=Mycobacterium sp. URHB0044 TaxID=1380386 RepID=UPI000A49D391|nr:hypothetical protein [Mycobacterium sp. URHB0044]
MSARLAAGAPAVEHTAAYVSACRQLGYQHPDLTAHPAQIRDWYGHDDGLDLRALDTDRTALSAVATAADDALRRHGDLTAQLAGAWSGGGSASAGEFLRRHGESADAVRVGLHRAVDAVAALRDELWRAVDTKVDAVQDIDDRSVAQRAEWLAAAQTVTTGAGDRAAASELVDQQVKPFVDNDIRSDWLAAMRQAAASATAAYDAAIAELDTAAASFDVPGEMGPRWAEPAATSDAAASPPAAAPISTLSAAMPATATMPSAAPSWQPAAFGSPPDGAPSAPAPSPAPPVDPLPATASQPPMTPTPPMPSLGDLGGGMPSLGTSGFGQQLADLIGGLVGSSEGLTPDQPEIDPAEEIDDEPDDETDESDEGEEDTEPAGAAEESDEEPDDEEPTDGDPIPPDETAVDPEPPPAETPVAPPPPEPPIPPAVPEALPEEKTPCEIAADELPQVGE